MIEIPFFYIYVYCNACRRCVGTGELTLASFDKMGMGNGVYNFRDYG